MDDCLKELQALNLAVGEKLEEEYYWKTLKVLKNLGPCDGDPSVPLEVWIGIAQALSDSSGCRIALEGAVLKPLPENSVSGEILGYREIAHAEPTLYLKVAPPGRQ